jgi:hypothetical protein
VGYSVTLKTNLTEREMKTTLRTFKSEVEAGDEITFFFAGHGVELSKENYLIPVDVTGDNPDQVKDETIALQRILDDMSEKKVKLTLALIDACRNNPFKSSGRNIGSGRGLAPTTPATGQMVVFSAGTGQEALDELGPADKSKNGVFTRVFIRRCSSPTGPLTRSRAMCARRWSDSPNQLITIKCLLFTIKLSASSISPAPPLGSVQRR